MLPTLVHGKVTETVDVFVSLLPYLPECHGLSENPLFCRKSHLVIPFRKKGKTEAEDVTLFWQLAFFPNILYKGNELFLFLMDLFIKTIILIILLYHYYTWIMYFIPCYKLLVYSSTLYLALFSQALDMNIWTRVSSTALRHMDSKGGFDPYILSLPPSDIPCPTASMLRKRIKDGNTFYLFFYLYLFILFIYYLLCAFSHSCLFG